MTHPTKAELLRFFKELASDIVNHAFAVPVGDYKAAKQEVERLLLLNERALKALLTTPPESKLREALQHAVAEIGFAIAIIGQDYPARAESMSSFLYECQKTLSTQTACRCRKVRP